MNTCPAHTHTHVQTHLTLFSWCCTTLPILCSSTQLSLLFSLALPFSLRDKNNEITSIRIVVVVVDAGRRKKVRLLISNRKCVYSVHLSTPTTTRNIVHEYSISSLRTLLLLLLLLLPFVSSTLIGIARKIVNC